MNKKTVIVSLVALIILALGVGVFMWKKAKVKKMEITQVSETQKEEPGDVDTSDWKTYKDEKYLFEINYPNEFKLEQENQTVRLKKDCSSVQVFEERIKCDLESNIGISITGMTLENFLKEYKDDYFDGSPLTRIKAQEDYMVDGILGKKLIGTTAEGAGGNDYIYVTRNGINYLISFNQNSDINKKVISTFNFLD